MDASGKAGQDKGRGVGQQDQHHFRPGTVVDALQGVQAGPRPSRIRLGPGQGKATDPAADTATVRRDGLEDVDVDKNRAEQSEHCR